jgi:hypothetical protein
MGRTLKKKAFDDDLMLSDDFDESILDKIEKQFGKSAVPEESSSDAPIPSLDDGEPSSAPSFSLDEFETTSGEGPDQPNRKEPEEQAAFETDAGKASTPDPSSPARRMARKVVKSKLIVIIAPCVFVLLLAAFYTIRLLKAPNADHPRITTVIKRSVPIPVRLEAHEFLILSSSNEEKILVTLALELKFLASDGPGQANAQEVELRDSIYRFLSDQHPPATSLKYWEKVVDYDLTAYLKSNFPHNGLQSVRLAAYVSL